MLHWKSVDGARSYEVDVDDAKVADVPAAALPVLHFALTTPLAVGLHRWDVKAIPAAGAAAASALSEFSVDPAGNWPDWAIGPFERYGKNPLLSPQGTGWESVNTLSPGVIFDRGKFRMLYRAQGKAWPSRIGYAESTDGVTFTRSPDPRLDIVEPFEKSFGLEDPRFYHEEGTYYTFYTGNNAKGSIALCEATSPDGIKWKKLGVILDHTKNAAVVCDPNGTPVKINGQYAMFTGNSFFGISYSDDLVTWGPIERINLNLPSGWVTPYEPCVAVTDYSPTQPNNIVLFIAGTLNGKGKWFYGISEVLFSKVDLTKKVAQLDDCILKAREPYDSGQKNKSLWTNCIIQHDGAWMLYFAAGDRYVALATAPVK